jgi:hypothetical protein
MPFPIYTSAVGSTCASEARFPVVETPNGDPDATTGWFDSSGFENGDECAFVYGAAQGTAGQLFNQVIGGRHYLTQEEFSNRDFATTGGGCLQSE